MSLIFYCREMQLKKSYVVSKTENEIVYRSSLKSDSPLFEVVLQVCWGNYDTITRHGLKVQKIKKGMAVNMKLVAFAYCSLNLFNLTQPISFLGSHKIFNSLNTVPFQDPNSATSPS